LEIPDLTNKLRIFCGLQMSVTMLSLSFHGQRELFTPYGFALATIGSKPHSHQLLLLVA